MAQQQGIIVLVDVAGALESRTLDGNTYMFDNMSFLGSTGQGTADLVTISPGTYWSDGSQGTEQVLNWLPSSLGAIPPTVPRSYQADRERQTDQDALESLSAIDASQPPPADVDRARQQVGSRPRWRRGGRNLTSGKVLDVTGNVVSGDATQVYNHPTPIITDITGEAVDEKIMYPAMYGSPDMVSDGWYWAASVDTSRPGTYAYTMHIQLHELVTRNGEPEWESVDLTCDSAIKVTTDPKRNAFTGGGEGLLPLPAVPPL